MRKTDKNLKTYFRSERIFSMNGDWYFATREGEQGPFLSRTRAEDGLTRFLNEQECLEVLRLTNAPVSTRVTNVDRVDAVPRFVRDSTKRLVY
jgi:hypothetical protein